jgi:alpha-tubulin suppressor-like RCC1 family protein
MKHSIVASIFLSSLLNLVACGGKSFPQDALTQGGSTSITSSVATGGALSNAATTMGSTGGSSITKMKSISAGRDNTCTVLSSGSIQCWGLNVCGQLGNGTTANSVLPVAVSGITNAVAVAAGENHNCAVLSSGSIQCWGVNGCGQLGNDTGGGDCNVTCTAMDSSVPVSVSGITNAIAVAGGSSHTCAVLSTGSVQCWGHNGCGQLGNGNSGNCDVSASAMDSSVPISVLGITNAVAVATGSSYSCALLNDGSIQCWGVNWCGELGNGGPAVAPDILDAGTPLSSVPVRVSGISNAMSLSAGHNHTCAVLRTGSVQCWGNNQFGQLGNRSTVNSSVPVPVSGISNAVVVTAGGEHSCAVLSTGSLQCWGDNYYGQLGNGTRFVDSNGMWLEDSNGVQTGLSEPVTALGITNGVNVATGPDHTCAVLSTGSIQCWGDDTWGELGNGMTANGNQLMSLVPVAVVGF